MQRTALLLVCLAAAPGCALAEAPTPVPNDVSDGVVQRYLYTPYGEVNGLRLADGVVVLVGPPMAPAVPETAPPGAHVRVVGQAAPDGALRASALINLDTGKSADDDGLPPASAPSPFQTMRPALSRCEVDGVVDLVLHGPRGEANGVILRDGSVVYFRPDLAPPALAPGLAFSAVGIGTRSPAGLAMEAIVAGSDRAAVRAAAAAATVFNRLAPPAPPAPPRTPVPD